MNQLNLFYAKNYVVSPETHHGYNWFWKRLDVLSRQLQRQEDTCSGRGKPWVCETSHSGYLLRSWKTSQQKWCLILFWRIISSQCGKGVGMCVLSVCLCARACTHKLGKHRHSEHGCFQTSSLTGVSRVLLATSQAFGLQELTWKTSSKGNLSIQEERLRILNWRVP